MSEEQNASYNSNYGISPILYGKMDADEFRDYILDSSSINISQKNSFYRK